MRGSVEMTDIERYPPKLAGDIFTVDDAGIIHGSWASGGSLSLIIGVD